MGMSIGRKVLLSGVVAVMPLALIAVATSGPASAATKFSGNAPGTVSCSVITGKVSFKPPLKLTSGGTTIKAKGAFSACHASNPAVSITSGKFKAVIAGSATQGCAGLAGGTNSETFTVKWKGDYNGTKAKFTATTIVVKGSTIVTNGAGDEGFELPNPSHEPNGTTTTGSFATVSSAESFAYTTETAGAFSAACGPGIHSVILGSESLNGA